MPGHRHDIGMAVSSGRQQDHRTRFQQLYTLDKDSSFIAIVRRAIIGRAVPAAAAEETAANTQ
jgi:hypothetical protein